MSTGHDHAESPGIGRAALDEILRDGAILEAMRRYRTVNSDYDLPYVAGYSTDARTIYRDRHLPERIEFEDGGRGYSFATTPKLLVHEPLEKALIDVRGWSYPAAHRVAEAAEEREALAEGLPLRGYRAAWAPYVKADERERIERAPPDLDLTPYLAQPVDRRLLARLQGAMGTKLSSKEEADYGDDRGSPAQHCGPDWGWEDGTCRFYREPNQCRKVLGWIAPRGKCRWWEPRKGK